MPRIDLLRPSYLNGLAPRDGLSLVPYLWNQCLVALDPGLGNSGTSLFDMSGNRNNASIVNADLSTVWDVDECGPSLNFNGATDYAIVPYFKGLDCDKYSISIWIKSTESGGNQGIVGRWQSASGSYSWLIHQGGSSLIWYYRTFSNLVVSFAGNNDGAWHHLCFTYDQIEARTYIDGVLRASVPQTVGGVYTTEPIVIGNYALTVSTTGQDWDGKWRAFGFWDRGLTANEVRLLASDPSIMYRLATSSRKSPVASGNRRRRILLGAF